MLESCRFNRESATIALRCARLHERPARRPYGEVAERLNAAVSKTVGPCKRSRGFESPPLRSFVPICRANTL